MGHLARLADAKRELEELYRGVPDESVNLTFQDFADLKQEEEEAQAFSSELKRPCSTPINPISENVSISSSLTKLLTLDFNTALQQSTHRRHHITVDDTVHGLNVPGSQWPQGPHLDHHGNRDMTGLKHGVESGVSRGELSVTNSDSSGTASMTQRPGTSHSNICTICSVYIYIFRRRCLVCGRVYCRQCVSKGMGEMTEGRKCIDCLGRRFSQRYIQRAGKVGCCMRYPGLVKQQELNWSEKGPRKSGERGYCLSTVMSRSRSPARTPTRRNASSPASSVVNSPCPAYSPSKALS